MERILVARNRGGGSFPDPQRVSTRRASSVSVAADLNADGRADLAMANDEDGSIMIVLAEEDGFGRARNIDVGASPRDLAIDDLNGDGILDIAVAKEGRSEGAGISILYGKGDGTFNDGPSLEIEPSPFTITIADLDGDGQPELVDGTRDNDRVRIWRADGAGSFEVADDFESRGPFDIATADLNGDGHPEIIATNFGGSALSVWPGLPGLAFAERRDLISDKDSGRFVIAEFNGDGVLDVAFAVLRSIPDLDEPNEVGILLGDGLGEFSPPTYYPVGDLPLGIAAADLDFDGHVDLVTANRDTHDVSYLAGDGNGGFSPARQFPAGAVPTAVVANDFDADGHSDLVVVNSISRDAYVLTGSPRFASDCDENGKVDTCDLEDGAVDVDLDGVLDVCEADCDGSEVPDDHEIATGVASDCDLNGVPDACDIASGEPDCDESGLLDACELASGALEDADENGTPDVCEGGFRVPGDCDGSTRLDLGDVVCVLGVLFAGTPPRFPCGDGTASDPGNIALLDGRPDEKVTLTTAVSILSFLFRWRGASPTRSAGF